MSSLEGSLGPTNWTRGPSRPVQFWPLGPFSFRPWGSEGFLGQRQLLHQLRKGWGAPDFSLGADETGSVRNSVEERKAPFSACWCGIWAWGGRGLRDLPPPLPTCSWAKTVPGLLCGEATGPAANSSSLPFTFSKALLAGNWYRGNPLRIPHGSSE